MAVAGRFARVELDTFELMLFRSLVGICVVVGVAAALGKLGQINARRLHMHLGRNLSHFAGQNLWFYALPLISLSELVALEFSSPLWVVLLAAVFLGEKLTVTRGFSAVLGFAGVLLVARPNITNIDTGTLAAALAAVGFAGTAIFTKSLTRTASTLCILFWLTVMQAVLGAVFALWDGQIAFPSLATLLPVGVVALTGLSAHFCLTTALSLAPAGLVMPMDFLRLPTMAVIGMLFYSEPVHIAVALGAILIIVANSLNFVHR